ncbi:Predicted membrane protein [Sebaldella termitidis]|jgi:uncharacterized membrane protein|uniref:Small multi-drug export n=1 Tax=Sebaldella termitidis (strain ATCC 33386 / NCTC 11300) TaxID=526218 RepID=D1AR86_SEBTE|nr:small multi-drug export protein [Sebaldella termitidis]ACZ07774.1 putative small multi-drug export [Sebaldella termitidis ATCC 33386]SUI23074.1 Predicted membrane protein [Sebaldella termitidis]
MQKAAQSIVAFIIGIFGVSAGKIIGITFISMIPIIELRGSIPVGFVMGLPWYASLVCSIIGNMLPVPVILLFVVKVFEFMKKHNILTKFVNKMEQKAMNRSEKVSKGEFWGLMLFVAIPLPGTGAWTGALIAALLKMNRRDSFLSILLGVTIAGTIITLGTYGVLGFIFK